MSTGIVKGGRTLSLMPTYACPAQCKDCGTVSSPNDRNNLPLDTCLSSIDQAAEMKFANVVFTGGEATLRWDDLLVCIRHAKARQLPTRLVTNAHWAIDDHTAAERISQLIDAGLDEINYSTGDEHARFIPVARVVKATVAALRHPLPVVIMIELRADRQITEATIADHVDIAALDSARRARLKIVESPWMPLRPGRLERYPEGSAINRNNLAAAGGCESVLQTYVVQATGKVGACCGLGMRIIPELNVGPATGESFLSAAVADAEDDFLKLLLRYKGPEQLIAWAAEKNPDIAWEGYYAHKCQACLRVYKDAAVGAVIREHHLELLGETLQSAWIEEELYPGLLDGLDGFDETPPAITEQPAI